jgi:hypothetical protein
MACRRIFAAAVSTAIFLSGIVYPGGALLCREANGDWNIEPFHAPHASSCVPESCGSDESDTSTITHRHERCEDTEASGLQAPVHAMKSRPAKECAQPAADSTAARDSALLPAVGALVAAAPRHSGIPATVLRI